MLWYYSMRKLGVCVKKIFFIQLVLGVLILVMGYIISWFKGYWGSVSLLREDFNVYFIRWVFLLI